MSIKQNTIELLDNIKNLVEEHGMSDSISSLINNIDIALEVINVSVEAQYTPAESNGVIFNIPKALTDDMKEKIAIAIGKFEKAHKIDFPTVYFSISKNANGGVPSNKKIIIDGVDFICEHFLSWNASGDEPGQLEAAYEKIKKDNSRLVPFAILSDDSYLCFDFDDTDEAPEVVRLHTGNTEDVADTFIEFLQKLNK